MASPVKGTLAVGVGSDFSALPIRLIPLYLDHFDSALAVDRAIPRWLMEALACHFRAFLEMEARASLNEAFGDRTIMQRRSLLRSGWRSRTQVVSYDEPLDEHLAFEEPIHLRLFEQAPVWILVKVLESFDSRGRQRYQVQPWVLTALADRLRRFWSGEVAKLDDAFGSQVGRQRNSIRDSKQLFTICFETILTHEDTKRMPRAKRGTSTPTEWTFAEVARKLTEQDPTRPYGEDNIRRLYKSTAGADKKTHIPTLKAKSKRGRRGVSSNK